MGQNNIPSLHQNTSPTSDANLEEKKFLSATCVGVIAHVEKPGAAERITQVVEALQKHHLTYLLEKETATLIGISSSLSEKELAQEATLLLVIGGDGTLLRVLHRLHCANDQGLASPKKNRPLLQPLLKPFFGLNSGSLGFLTCLPASEVEKAIAHIANQSYQLSYRSLLQIESFITNDQGEKMPGSLLPTLGLNDIVISRGERSQLVKIAVAIDNQPLTEYHADGLIIATPTGSTAYSLAAGGPILTPESAVLVMTPICPHAFTSRSMVLAEHHTITLQSVISQEAQELFLTIDGRPPLSLPPQETIQISLASERLPLAMLPEVSFFEILRQKLHWRGNNLSSPTVP